ncbi:MAG: hypothetical protein EON54_09625 [Alcaligenaceae bacterium]|nr:MAG: hypothetical protein EON54_09625 [Alcaligenaceae bacterium]
MSLAVCFRQRQWVDVTSQRSREYGDEFYSVATLDGGIYNVQCKNNLIDAIVAKYKSTSQQVRFVTIVREAGGRRVFGHIQ